MYFTRYSSKPLTKLVSNILTTLHHSGQFDVVRNFGQILSNGDAPNDNDYTNDPQYKQLQTVCTDLRQFHIVKPQKGESASHWIQQDQPNSVNEKLHSFFKETSNVFESAKNGLASSKI